MQILHWKMGNLEHKIIPTKEAIENFQAKVGAKFPDCINIITGPDIELEIHEVNLVQPS